MTLEISSNTTQIVMGLAIACLVVIVATTSFAVL